MTKNNAMLELADRAAFESAYKHLDLSRTCDAWERSVYSHSHVGALWEGWLRGRATLRSASAEPVAKVTTALPIWQQLPDIPDAAPPVTASGRPVNLSGTDLLSVDETRAIDNEIHSSPPEPTLRSSGEVVAYRHKFDAPGTEWELSRKNPCDAEQIVEPLGVIRTAPQAAPEPTRDVDAATGAADDQGAFASIDDVPSCGQENDYRRARPAKAEPTREEIATWLPMSTAPRNRKAVLLKLKDRIPNDREDLRRWDGIVFIGRSYGDVQDWGFAAPVGMGGFPDEWFDGWRPDVALTAPPTIVHANGGDGTFDEGDEGQGERG